MTEDGKKVLDFIKEIRRFSEELASLLETVDDLMMKNGWTATGGTTYANCSSQSLDLAKRWYPYDLFRFYQNQKFKSILTFVSIILEEDIYWMEEPPATPINEPLISAGYFHYNKGEKIKLDTGNYWLARWHEFIENRKDDGRIYDKWQENWEEIGENPFHSYMCFGYPLISINSTAEIESKIVKHLLDNLPK